VTILQSIYIFLEKGELLGWGNNNYNKLGGARSTQLKIDVVKIEKKVLAVDGGSNHSIVIVED
jgi:hypothetical protein